MSKIKAIDPKIVVNGNVDKPYYSIEYYDTSDNQWHIGYSSYELKNVIEWLDTDFDVIKADVAPVRHGRWKQDILRVKAALSIVAQVYICSECGKPAKMQHNFCPHCGAKMDLKEV